MPVVSKLSEVIYGLPENFSMKVKSLHNFLKKKGVTEDELSASDFLNAFDDKGQDGKVDLYDILTADITRPDYFGVDDVSNRYRKFSTSPDDDSYRAKITTFKKNNSYNDYLQNDNHFDNENYLYHTRGIQNDLEGIDTDILEEIQSDVFGKRYEGGRLPLQKTYLRKGIEGWLDKSLSEGRPLAIPLKGKVDGLLRSDGIQKHIYDKKVPSILEKIANDNDLILDFPQTSGKIFDRKSLSNNIFKYNRGYDLHPGRPVDMEDTLSKVYADLVDAGVEENDILDFLGGSFEPKNIGYPIIDAEKVNKHIDKIPRGIKYGRLTPKEGFPAKKREFYKYGGAGAGLLGAGAALNTNPAEADPIKDRPEESIRAPKHELLGDIANFARSIETPIGRPAVGMADWLDKVNYDDEIGWLDRLAVQPDPLDFEKIFEERR